MPDLALIPQCRRPETTGATHLDTLKFNSFCSSGPALFNIIPIKLDKKMLLASNTI